ncbi:MAG: carboxyl transferase domain-containing protein, partial [Pacificimonas sp.]
VEFLVDIDSGAPVFIEANARLQVEHTVTEEVFGVDLVAAQLAIADGKSLADIGLAKVPASRGTAIQARINLERFATDGTVNAETASVAHYRPPGGPGVRVDGVLADGYAAHPGFDTLAAKLIVHAPGGMEAARARLIRALKEFTLEGPDSSLPLLRLLTAKEEPFDGRASTRFIDEHLVDLMSKLPTRHNGDTANTDDLTLTAPMDGVVGQLLVSHGDPVWEGRAVAIVEAMKMEHEVRAAGTGLVDEVMVEEGAVVRTGAPLFTLTAADVSKSGNVMTSVEDLDHIRPELAELKDRKGAGLDQTRPDAVAKRHSRGNRTARENIADLCDADSFVEFGSLVLAPQRARRSMDDLIENTTGDGMVCGIGHVNGDRFGPEQSRVMAMTYDYMVLAGTQGGMNHYKKDRMFEIAREQRLPVVLYAEGGGGRPGDTDMPKVAGLDCLAFNYFAKLSALAPTIGIVNGRCFAGNAVLAGCCDVIIATEDSNLGLGGPAMIEGGGLGVFSPDEVGPSAVQSANGVIDILVKDEAEATKVAKQYLSYFQGDIDPGPAPDPRKLRFAIPENRLRVYDMRALIDRVADEGSVLELRRGWAPGMITALVRIDGKPVGLIANDPRHLSGAIDAEGADKAARFMQLCDAYDLPIVTLVDCPGFMVGPEHEETAIVRHACRMMVVGANVAVPVMSIVVRKGYGLGAQAMTGGSFKANLFTASWPTGEFGGMGLEGAVRLGFRKELEAIEDETERAAAYDKMVEKMYERGKAISMASLFEIDEVIDPADTRKWILAGLSTQPPKPARTGKKRPNIDSW